MAKKITPFQKLSREQARRRQREDAKRIRDLEKTVAKLEKQNAHLLDGIKNLRPELRRAAKEQYRQAIKQGAAPLKEVDRNRRAVERSRARMEREELHALQHEVARSVPRKERPSARRLSPKHAKNLLRSRGIPLPDVSLPSRRKTIETAKADRMVYHVTVPFYAEAIQTAIDEARHSGVQAYAIGAIFPDGRTAYLQGLQEIGDDPEYSALGIPTESKRDKRAAGFDEYDEEDEDDLDAQFADTTALDRIKKDSGPFKHDEKPLYAVIKFKIDTDIKNKYGTPQAERLAKKKAAKKPRGRPRK